jgi:hypothetical protein
MVINRACDTAEISLRVLKLVIPDVSSLETRQDIL